MFYLNAPPGKVCPPLFPHCSAGSPADIYMKILFNLDIAEYYFSLIILSYSLGIEHNFNCEATNNCKNYNTNDQRFPNLLIQASDYSYALFKCVNSYDNCANLLPGATIGMGL
jgi:hypothetical protein